MKKVLQFLGLSLVLVLAMAVVAGCGQEAAAPEEEEVEVAEVDYDIPENLEAMEMVLAMVTEKAELLAGGEYGDLHEAIVASGGREGEEYAKVQGILKEIMTDTGATYVYTLIKIDDGMTNLIVDASEGEDADDYGAEYPMEPQFELAFAGEPAAAKHTWVDDSYGVQKSAFAPIYNTAGDVIAILGIDYPAPELEAFPELSH